MRFDALLFVPFFVSVATAAPLVPVDWDPVKAADKVLEGLINTSAAEVKGAHDAEFVIVGDRAYVVATTNNVKPGEAAAWDFCHVALSVVNVQAMKVERYEVFAESAQRFDNETLPTGACFVPRILRKDEHTLRCFFASEAPGMRQAQTWWRDYDLKSQAFEKGIHKARLKTAAGTFDFQPEPFYKDAVAQGFTGVAKDYGMYLFDSFKVFDGRTYVALNNYPGGQNALAMVNDGMDTFEVLGHYNAPGTMTLTESSVNRLPDGTWMAIVRQERGNHNYTFTTSKDGREWTANEPRSFVPNGAASKPTFDCFNGVYYLGWQESTQVNHVNRSVFNVDVSTNGMHWTRKYRFATDKSFQYPSFHQYQGRIYLTVTQGDTDATRKERIMFGRLE